MVTAFVWYCWTVFSGEATTNPISWWLWFAETAVSLMLYADRTRDTSKWFAEAVSMVGVTMVSGYLIWEVLSGGEKMVFASVETVDYIAFLFAALAFCVWLATRKKVGAGLALWIFQLALISAVFPLLRATFADSSSEPLGPWVLWTGVFFLQTVCAWLRWDGYEPVISPINYTLTHGLVVVAITLGAASA